MQPLRLVVFFVLLIATFALAQESTGFCGKHECDNDYECPHMSGYGKMRAKCTENCCILAADPPQPI